MKNNIDPEKAWNTLSTTLDEIKNKLPGSNFNAEELSRIFDNFEKVELQAYEVKLHFELGVLFETQPNLTPMQVLMKMFSLLPDDLEEHFIPILTNYVLEHWKALPMKMAA